MIDVLLMNEGISFFYFLNFLVFEISTVVFQSNFLSPRWCYY